ncbi:rod shape-determining protein MreC [Candidatus Microgenomates bacterium]|nr:rod shape-determining protein MreC [Candidatus Microgenomates bacterium]
MRIFLALLALSVALVILDSRGVLLPAKSAVALVTAPIEYSLYQAKLGVFDWLSFFKFWRSGEARIKNLEQRNLELLTFEKQAKVLEEENSQLRGQLGVRSLAAKKLLPATVLGVGQTMELAVGSRDDVRVGMTVVSLDNLVGRVTQVTATTSFVQLPTDSGAKIPVKVGRVSGLAMGQFDASVVLDRVAQNEGINTGDIVLTSGEGSSYVPNLIVGKVGKSESAKTDIFSRFQIELPVDYGRLSTVFVILD